MAGYFEETATTSDFGPLKIYRKELDTEGKPVFHEVEDRKSAYIVPPTGMYSLKCTGFSEPWTEENRFAEPDASGKRPEVTKTNLEIEIIDGPGKGKRFIWSFVTFKIGFGKTWSNLGSILAAGKYGGEKPPKGEKLYRDDVIGCEFMATVKASDAKDDDGKPKYASIVGDTITTISTDDAYDPFNTANKDADAA